MTNRSITHNELQTKNYGENFSSFRENKKYYSRKVYSVIKDLIKHRKFSKALDLGCADGEFAAIIKRDFGFDEYGLDLTDEIEIAKKKGIKAIKHDVSYKFPFVNNFFDLIHSTEVIEHIYDTDFFISEIYRILKRKGIVILTTPNLASLPNRFRLLFGMYTYPVPEYNAGGAGHIRSYTIPVMKKQLIKHGFKIIKTTSANFPFPMENPRIPKIFKNYAMNLGDLIPEFGSHMVVVAQK
jgi:2-polyprenyl-3-methyl-5-hydroxy-6-metoxy-1,4-benzoquinol methylase